MASSVFYKWGSRKDESARPGKGKASMYLAGTIGAVPTSDPLNKSGASTNGVNWHKGAMSKRFDGKDELSSTTNKTASSGPTATIKSAITDEDEQAAVAAMFQAQTANWEETQEKMSHAQRIYNNPRGTGFSRGGKPHAPHVAPQIDRPLPPSYVCYRCGQKGLPHFCEFKDGVTSYSIQGHWIQDCPTNNDRDFDNKPRIKRTTGIPRSMLKAVTTPTSGELGQGVMVTPEGGYVVAQPDSCVVVFQSSAGLDRRIVTQSIVAKAERDFICPNCAKKIASLDKLIVDKPARIKVADYIEKAIEDSKKEGEEESTPRDGASGAANQNEQTTQEQQDFYTDQQPDLNMDMPQMVVDSIPQLQAQISQISLMLQNPSLPNQVRQATEMQHQQLQMQLQQAQAVAAALAAATTFQQQQQQVQNAGGAMGFGMQGFQQGSWANNQFSNQQPAVQDSAYQRLPINNRRRNLKRERPSDFLEIGGESDNKVARYWE
ncbi:hypothetical protein C0993_007169 [Termitomyces sp. T159_Od127]|nr:hypothetical protein C0993_007169 [Termitomyces sp. T159_Od127]